MCNIDSIKKELPSNLWDINEVYKIFMIGLKAIFDYRIIEQDDRKVSDLIAKLMNT